MGLDVYSRREYKQGKFVYLLDDEEKTAWIDKGHIGRCKRYRLPDHVMVEGERYTVESVEMGAFNHSRTLRHLVIPDIFIYVDGDTLYGLDNLRSVHIGKGVELLTSWNFRLCPQLHNIHIDKDNPHIKYENGMVLSKDGKKLWASFVKRPHIVIPEGVEEINNIVFINDFTLESVCFPKTLRKMGDNSFDNCPKLHRVVLPEGFEKLRIQSFQENQNLRYVDLPSTLADLGEMTFADCPNLETVILRSPKKLDFRGCFGEYLYDKPLANAKLYVPENLVEQYQQDPEWSVFKHIQPIREKSHIRESTTEEHEEMMRIMHEIAENEMND